jgi:hypothetical protein
MSDEAQSLQGWAPTIGDAATLAEVVDRAFDYRGDVTLTLDDGREVVGYLFNRNGDVAEPFVQLFERDENGSSTIPYARIRAIRFTGRDTAAGTSYAAWLRRREAAKAASSPPGA